MTKIPHWVTSAGRWLSLIPLLIAVILVVVFNWGKAAQRVLSEG